MLAQYFYLAIGSLFLKRTDSTLSSKKCTKDKEKINLKHFLMSWIEIANFMKISQQGGLQVTHDEYGNQKETIERACNEQKGFNQRQFFVTAAR